MESPTQSRGNGDNSYKAGQGSAAGEKQAAVNEVAKAFQAVLERENQALREQFSEGFNPMEAQAKALLWLVALQGIHGEAVKQAIAENNSGAASGWAEDLGKLSAVIAILETIQPIP